MYNEVLKGAHPRCIVQSGSLRSGLEGIQEGRQVCGMATAIPQTVPGQTLFIGGGIPSCPSSFNHSLMESVWDGA